MDKLQDIFKFLELTHNLQKVKRRMLVKGEERTENDVEHSFHLSMLAWYIADSQNLNLNKELIIKYALIHDLVEVYAGNTFVFTTDLELKNSQKEREEKAAQRIEQEFPEFKDLHDSIKDFFNLKNGEAKFIYALDKIIPMALIYLDNGRTWQKENTTLDMIIKEKMHKVAISPEAKKYFDAIIKTLEDGKESLFN